MAVAKKVLGCKVGAGSSDRAVSRGGEGGAASLGLGAADAAVEAAPAPVGAAADGEAPPIVGGVSAVGAGSGDVAAAGPAGTVPYRDVAGEGFAGAGAGGGAIF